MICSKSYELHCYAKYASLMRNKKHGHSRNFKELWEMTVNKF